MKAAFPHMGNNWVCFKGMLDALGITTFVPPAPTDRTFSLGVKNSPEFVCFPFKINIGNFIEASELGADTLIMAGGNRGTCRFQNYSRLQEKILKDLGYKFEMVVIDTNNIFKALFKTVRALNPRNSKLKVAWAFLLMIYKARALARIEELRRYKLPRELTAGQTEAVTRQMINRLDTARTIRQCLKLRAKIRDAFSDIKEKKANLLKIGLVGEIYTVSDPAMNMDIEKELSLRGAEVYNPMSFYRWIKVLSGIDWARNRLARIARPYLKEKSGGEDQQSIGCAIEFARQKFDGLVLVHPFTCMPEVIARTALNRISAEFNIPILAVSLDEHTSKERMLARIEVFVDLLKRKKGLK